VVRILVTNDDGIDSVGLLHLARAMGELGEVVVIAPDREYSGAGASVGALIEYQPVVVRHHLDGVAEAWSLNGPPALCVMYTQLGVFGEPFDLVVSGINPGANVGRSVYYSGTVGACLAARNGGISGVAVSQAVTGWGIEGQGWVDIIQNQKWHVAAEVAKSFVSGLIADPPHSPVVVNLNVPNRELPEIAGWELTEVGRVPPRSMAGGRLVESGRPDVYDVEITWGDKVDLPEHTDGGAIERDLVTVSYLTRLESEQRHDLTKSESALDRMFG
jgi:5'-nucleotidase